MGTHLNMFVPLGCPHCHAELLTTLDDVQEEVSLRCSRCGTVIELRPEDLGVPGAFPSAPEHEGFWLET
ncbi:MAG TPA: hypothetical protein VMY69_02680 [Phycisphaerae bacterium]|nr:hypothetical protein [Phycisphaerae bacterium]